MATRRRNVRARTGAPQKRRTRREVTEAAKRRSRSRLSSEKADLDEEWQTVNARIGALEDFITGSIVREERRRRLRSQNILPPPEQTHGNRPVRHSRRMSRWEAQNYYGKRQKNGIAFLLWFGAVCGMAWWLLTHGGFGLAF